MNQIKSFQTVKFEYKFNFRAGEVATFSVGQLLLVNKVKFTIISENTNSKAITIVLIADVSPGESLVKHINIRGKLTEFDLTKESAVDSTLLKQFNKIEVSAPEDAKFQLVLVYT